MDTHASNFELDTAQSIITYIAVTVAHNAAMLPGPYVSPHVVGSTIRFHLDTDVVTITTPNGKIYKLSVEELPSLPRGGKAVPLMLYFPSVSHQN